MAKQTFTTGQVLTAAQMTSLQQTAMGGGSATAKTASYTLVAADAGTTVIMNSASATTITVNTSLFSAGDTVFIQNIGAGVSTITAGTATVNTASSLALAQYDSGSLYFTAAGASIFSKAAGAGASGGAYTSIATGSLSGTSLTISSIDQTYKDLYLRVFNATATAGRCGIRLNGQTASIYRMSRITATDVEANNNASAGQFNPGGDLSATTGQGIVLTIEDYTTTSFKKIALTAVYAGPDVRFHFPAFDSTTAITSITIVNTDAVAYTGGTYILYGVK